MTTHYTKPVLDFINAHGFSEEIAELVGFAADGDAITFRYEDADGEYFRRRRLPGGKTIQPKGRKLSPWTPLPIDGALLVLEGESDLLAAVDALYGMVDVAEDGQGPEWKLTRSDHLPPPVENLVPVAIPGVGNCHDQIVALAEEHLADVVIVFDGDDAGRTNAQKLAKKIADCDSSITAEIVMMPEGKDLSDILAAADLVDRVEILASLLAEAQAAEEEIPREDPPKDSKDAAEGGGEKQSKPPQSQVILELAREAGITCWATPAGEPYATMPVDGHLEHHRLAERASRDWLSRVFYVAEEKAPSAQALQDALGVLRGDALWGGAERVEVHVRHAAHGDAVYIDLGDPEWRAIEITATGWKIVSAPPVRFRRPRGMLPLPEPVSGGSLDALREMLNVTEESWPLVCGWLVGTLAPRGPYPVLGIHGEQGAAKSSAARLLRDLIDPNTAPLRSEPRDERDLVIAASNGRTVALDNVSRLSASLSDALCRLATGGGFATRELFSDGEEIIFSATRPAMITGIGEVADRGDLLDRSILVTLEAIPEDARLTDAQLAERWEQIAPQALGGLLDAASTALRRGREVHLPRLPRMADHAVWVEAAAPALGWGPGAYIEIYDAMKRSASETALEASPLTDPLRSLAEDGFTGSATDLLGALEEKVEDKTLRLKAWPKAANSLAAHLRRLAADLRVDGIEITDAREGHDRRRVWRVEQVGKSSSASSASSSASGHKPHENAESVADDDADGLLDADGPADGLLDAHRPQANGSGKPDSGLADDADGPFPIHSGLADATAAEEAEAERIAAKLGEGVA